MSSGTTPKDAMSGICGPGAGPQAVSPCQKTHWVKVRLTFRDDKTNVSAAVGKITLGAAAIAPGPLANGVLEARNLQGGSYEASFPDIDADEWAKG